MDSQSTIRSWFTWPRVAATVLSIAGLGILTVPAALRGPVAFSPDKAIEWLTLVALVWAAAFAADNLTELKAARLSELLPLIDVNLSRGYEQGQAKLVLSFRNIGRGHAAGFRATIWQLDLDQLYWVPERLSDLPDLIAPGETLPDIQRPNDWVKYALQESECDMILEARYRDPIRKEHTLRVGYKIGHLTDDIREVTPPTTGSIHSKINVIQKELNRLEEDFHLADRSQCLTVEPDGSYLAVNLVSEQGALHGWRFGAAMAVVDIVESVRGQLTERGAT